MIPLHCLVMEIVFEIYSTCCVTFLERTLIFAIVLCLFSIMFRLIVVIVF